MDKKMRKVTKKIRRAESILKKAEKENMRLANYDERIRDPEIKKYHQMKKKTPVKKAISHLNKDVKEQKKGIREDLKLKKILSKKEKK